MSMYTQKSQRKSGFDPWCGLQRVCWLAFWTCLSSIAYQIVSPFQPSQFNWRALCLATTRFQLLGTGRGNSILFYVFTLDIPVRGSWISGNFEKTLIQKNSGVLSRVAHFVFVWVYSNFSDNFQNDYSQKIWGYYLELHTSYQFKLILLVFPSFRHNKVPDHPSVVRLERPFSRPESSISAWIFLFLSSSGIPGNPEERNARKNGGSISMYAILFVWMCSNFSGDFQNDYSQRIWGYHLDLCDSYRFMYTQIFLAIYFQRGSLGRKPSESCPSGLLIDMWRPVCVVELYEQYIMAALIGSEETFRVGLHAPRVVDCAAWWPPSAVDEPLSTSDHIGDLNHLPSHNA